MQRYSTLLSLILLLLTIIFYSPLASAHFSLAPKIEVAPLQLESPEKELVHVAQFSASRVAFTDYLQRITAFDTKYDRVQSAFFSHFEIIRGIAFFHPDNVHKIIDTIAQSKNKSVIHQLEVTDWFKKQAEIFSRIFYYSNKAKESGQIKRPEVQAVLDFYAAGAKTEFLEELIVFGSMSPTLSALNSFVENIVDDKRNEIKTGIENDIEITPMDEQKLMKKRWADFRHQAMEKTNAKQQCDHIFSPDLPHDKAIIKVNDHSITLGAYLAIFGKPRLERQWNVVSKLNCNQLVLFYTMADLVDQLGIAPHHVNKKINVSADLYLAATQIVQELGPLLVSTTQSTNNQSIVQQLMVYPEVVKLKDQLLKTTEHELSKGDIFIDDNFLASIPWTLKRSMSPKHSIHF